MNAAAIVFLTIALIVLAGSVTFWAAFKVIFAVENRAARKGYEASMTNTLR